MADIVVGNQPMQTMSLAPGASPGYGTMAAGVPQVTTGTAGVDWLGLIRRRFWLILGFVACGAMVSWGVTKFLAQTMPEYTATAMLAATSVGKSSIMEMENPMFGGDLVNSFMNSQAMFIESDMVLGEVVVDPEVIATKWYRDAKAKPEVTIGNQLRKAISVKPQRGTVYMLVSATTRYRDDSRLLANKVVDKFLLKSSEFSSKEYLEKIEALTAEFARLDRTAREKLEALGNYMNQAQLTQINDSNPEVYARFQNVSAYLVQADSQLQGMKGMYEKFNDPNLDLRSNPEIRTSILSDPRMSNYRSMTETLEVDIQRASDRFGPNHPRVKGLQIQLQFVRSKMDTEEARLVNEYTERYRHQANEAYEYALANFLRTKERYEAVLAEVRDFDHKRSQLQKFSQEYTTAQTLSNDVSRALAKMQIDRRDPALRRMDLQAPAEEPTSPSFPNLQVNLAIGIMLSLAMGFGLAFILERYNKTIRSVDDVNEMGLDLLGFIPHIDDEDVDVKEPRLVSQFLPDSMISEHYRLVRSVVRAKIRQSNMRSLVILSPQPADGKTSVAINLAISFAHIGMRVLLIEADLRRSVFTKLFNQTKTMGLMDWLSGKTNNTEDVVSTTSLPNLDVISAGTRLNNPSEWLETGRLQGLISSLPQYSLIIVDAPPALVVSDGYVLAGQVDGVILVTRAGVSTRRAIYRLCRELETHNSNLLGIVLNAVRVKSREHGYYYGGYYYRYRPTEKNEEKTAGEITSESPSGPSSANKA